VFAGWIKFCGRAESDGMHIEVQHSRCPETTARDKADTIDPHPGDLLSSTLMTALDNSGHDDDETATWYMISCSSPVPAQREMAALEAMSRREDFNMLTRPTLALQGQGGIAHRIWPEQVRINMCVRAIVFLCIRVCRLLSVHFPDTRFTQTTGVQKTSVLPFLAC
jgi:hypothetical protein